MRHHDIFGLERDFGSEARSSKVNASDNEIESRENAEMGFLADVANSTLETLDQGDILLDVSQVADYLRISRSSVYKLIERRQIPAIKIGRLLRIRKREFDKALYGMGNGI